MAQSVYDSDDDPDLRRAIELSLAADSTTGARKNETIELSSDESESDEDLKRAIALSLGQDITEGARKSGQGGTSQDENSKQDEEDEDDSDDDDLNKTPVYRPKKKITSEPTTKSLPVQEKPTQEQDAPQSSASSILGLMGTNRKQMEEERLARLAAKRKAPDTEQESQGRESRPRAGAVPAASTSMVSNTGPSKKRNTSAHLPFPKGVVKKTFARGFSRTSDDIKIDEILQKEHLQLAVLSSFQWDEAWLNSKIDFKRTNVVLVAFANSEEQQHEITENARQSFGGTKIKMCFPPMSGIGNMHSKLQLLKFANYLRIVVPSGNLVPYDWGETGVMENMVFIIDLPLLKDPDEAHVLTPFGEELAFFLRAQGLEQSLVKSLEKYDFSETKGIAFVHTIGTSRAGNADDWKRTGYCGLGRAISALGLDTSADVELDYIVSSLGSVNHDLLTAIYYAAQGNDGLKEYNERSARGKRAKAISIKAALGKINDQLRIYFPSQETVERSRGGTESAGSICAQSKWWNSDTFPRQLVHESQNVRPGVLLHSKMLLARSKNSPGKQPIAWAYIGSANLSESAWGRLTRDKRTGNPKLNCRNWECGVVLSPSARTDKHISDSRAAANNGAAAAPADDMSVFLGSIPVPIIWPSEAYGRTKTKKPWLFLE
ncbi:hypothetical protein PFICI_12612 [Pestalotiopsis fici W106-1]|uniref:PLD phosphodiesterase domain-containing protein n=1 Tax=Pestalotiopsis fici (strain W106-1 / CGMCC3.15140) TaxID=1229662 RepID=W3WP79_PESFW|nr:uncharacterized protein PFICI_12612 [Pestalotiopsis fici W106-1]ETS75668.1 hypothetical protein PFICI_12612 [Pestalotiopsis fici W106-1]